MAILITGGAGFIGSNFILNFIQNSKEDIICLDKLSYAGNLNNLNEAKKKSNFVFLHCDIGNSKLVLETLTKFKPRAVINFAAETHVDRSIDSPKEFIDTNIVCTFNFLEALRRYFDGLKSDLRDKFKILHVSTDEVYGTLKKNDPPFKEGNSYKPNSPYSASKAASDHLFRSWHHTYNLPTLITNCSNNYGPYQFPEKFIPLFIINALNNDSLPIYGDGQQIRDWLYVDDHCRAIMTVLERGLLGETYNIGGNSEKSNLEVATILCETLDELKPRNDGKSFKDKIIFIKDRPGHDRRYAIDISKINKQLNWAPLETFESGFLKTIKWYLNNMEWVKKIQSRNYKDWVNKHYK